jgi:hypothetical protein
VVFFLTESCGSSVVPVDTCRGQHHGRYYSSAFCIGQSSCSCVSIAQELLLQYQHTHVEKHCALRVRLLAMTAGQL